MHVLFISFRGQSRYDGSGENEDPVCSQTKKSSIKVCTTLNMLVWPYQWSRSTGCQSTKVTEEHYLVRALPGTHCLQCWNEHQLRWQPLCFILCHIVKQICTCVEMNSISVVYYQIKREYKKSQLRLYHSYAIWWGPILVRVLGVGVYWPDLGQGVRCRCVVGRSWSGCQMWVYSGLTLSGCQV